LRYVFDDCVLDSQRRELTRGGSAVAVEPLVFDIIACLIEHRDRVVSRDDLRTMVWEGRIVSESTLGSAINAARVAIGDTGEQQRLIRTLPRKGFRFVGTVRVEPASAAPAMAAAAGAGAVVPAALELPGPTMHPVAGADVVVAPARPALRIKALIMLVAGVAVIAAALGYVLWPASAPRTAPAGEKFDASVIPLVTDETRRSHASYPNRPDHKALAIIGGANGVADGHSNVEAAKQDALQRCYERITDRKRQCRLYAVDMDVVWVKEAMPTPAPADLRFEPLEQRLEAMEIPTLMKFRQEEVAKTYAVARNHRALALATGLTYPVVARGTRAEAARLAVERCAELHSIPCLLLSVDGMLTIRIPKDRHVVRIFLPSKEHELPDEHKERIGRIYQGPEWRALAKGKNSWHAVADAPSEAAAVDGALKACAQADSGCRLYAIGNFHVADP
jgi:DNA-binding winged helix-turn-helix (wHTH) protein